MTHPILSRRSFLVYSLGSLASISLGIDLLGHNRREAHASHDPNAITLGELVPPLFCTAYITPNAAGQENQEAIVARYPLILVPQDNRRIFVEWRNRVKALNPNILILGYQMVIEETTVPGPGHDILRTITNSYCKYPEGHVPTITLGPGKERRLFDPRTHEWQEKFLEACLATLMSYPFDGLFLDQCSVFHVAHPDPAIRTAMIASLQDTLSQLRGNFPKKLLIGNSSIDWGNLNGELLEGRLTDADKELQILETHTKPYAQLFLSRLAHANDSSTVRREMNIAHSHGALYGAAVDYQHALWFDEFDHVIAEFHRKHPPDTPSGFKFM